LLQRKKPLTRRQPLRPRMCSSTAPERDAKAEAERKLWVLLADREVAGLRFRQRESVGPFAADFYCPAARFVILVNGEETADPLKTAWFRSQGYRVLTFDAAEVASNPQGVLDAIADAFMLRVIARKG
jgi:very-short-patch-repair endonuclease